jgi:hypothetical protein
MSANHHSYFSQVLWDELKEVEKRRLYPEERKTQAPNPSGNTEEEKERAAQEKGLEMDLVALALSGGGIRSATFALGVLQGLASFGLLRCFDYLSTVSGGGYIGGWLTAWIKREGRIEDIEQQLKPSRREQAQGRHVPPLLPLDDEPEPIHHLRAYSSYLAPRRGLFSADSWVLGAIYGRNILLNQLVLLPACASLLLAPRLVERFYDWEGQHLWDGLLLGVMFALLLLALGGIAVRTVLARRRDTMAQTTRLQKEVRCFQFVIVLPLFLFALLASWEFGWDLVQQAREPQARKAEPARSRLGMPVEKDTPPSAEDTTWWEYLQQFTPWDHKRFQAWEKENVPAVAPHLSGSVFFGAFFGTALAIIYFPFHLFALLTSAKGSRGRNIQGVVVGLLASFIAGSTGGALLYLGFAVVYNALYYLDYDVAVVTLTAPPLVLLIIMLSIILAVGLLGAVAEEDEREWWASLCGWLSMYAVAWIVIVGISLFGPLLVMKLPGWGRAVLGMSWLGTVLSTLRAGESAKTGRGTTSRPLELLALAAPPVILLGILVLVALLLDLIMGNVPDAQDIAGYFQKQLEPSVYGILSAMIGCAVFAVLLGLRIDVNLFSLHGLYADRLVRCYLGASRVKQANFLDRPIGAKPNSHGPPRRPDPVTGFDPHDDFPLPKLRIGPDDADAEQPYYGPFHLLNTAMNLLEGDELAWQERKAESFVLTPLYCGSRSTGYRMLDPAEPDVLRLGTAVTLSGAAVSPNMGYHSSPAVTALLTVFNVRLGGWVDNPRHKAPGNTGPWQGILYLLKELFGRTNNRAGYVYLSDGGHFDNLGVYELVRRRCRYVLVCDAEQDSEYTFEALSALIRKCSTDFGVRIEIDVSPIVPQGPERRSRWHCAIGRIRYDDVDSQAVPGVLIYLKASLTGDEPSDVQNYAQQHPPFPHQTTLDQFFTESQFESYRSLGFHIARDVLCDAMQGIPNDPSTNYEEQQRVVKKLFANLHSRWFPPPPGFNENFLQSVQGYFEIEEALRKDPNLAAFSRSLYPELLHEAAPDEQGAAASEEERARRRRAELHLVCQMLQVMEDAWLSLRLEGYFAYPMNRGWMNTFRRWAGSATFRRYWPGLRGEFGKDFVRFCEKELRLGHGFLRAELLRPEPTLAPWQRQGLTRLWEEFEREWPRLQGQNLERLRQLILQATDWGQDDPAVWLLTLTPPADKPSNGENDGRQTCGLLVAWGAANQAEVELMLWMRGPNRDVGLGRRAMSQVLAHMRDSPRYRNATLRTRFPKDKQPCREDRMRSAMWQAFFIYYGFHPAPDVVDSGKTYLVLQAAANAWTQAPIEG